jgi:O-antigen ligase
MPPQLAMLLCIGFVIWVYRWEARTYPGHEKILWIPALWMMRCASRGVDSWFSSTAGSARLDPIVVAIMLILGIIIVLGRPVRWGPIIFHNSGIFLFYLLLTVSVTWAEELESPIIKTFRPLTDFFMALVVVTSPRPKEAIIAVFRRASILLIPMSIVLIKYYPYLGRMQSKHWGADNWIGVTTHKNPLGQLVLMSVIAFVWTFGEALRNGHPAKRQYVPLLYFAMAGYLFYAGGDADSRSTTSMLCTIAGIAVYFLLGRMELKIGGFVRKMVVLGIILGGLFVATSALDISLKALVAQSQGKGSDLAGRDLIWSETIRLGMENPVLGSGYGGFWVDKLFDRLDPGIDNHPLQAHNGYIETFANLGFVGVGLMCLFLLQTLISSVKHIQRDFDYGRLRFVILVIALLMNYTEATIPIALHVWWFGFLVAVLYADPWIRRPQEEHVLTIEPEAVLPEETPAKPTANIPIAHAP